MNQTRLLLTESTPVNDFKNFYWLKSELIHFCRINGLATQGGKKEIAKRIEIFISTGKRIHPRSKISDIRDSINIITPTTPVVNYKNDAVTRAFFVSKIGRHFRFNAYLRQFTEKKNLLSKNLTYGDLVHAWLLEESEKKNLNTKAPIGKQFEYNQFTRDFFAHEKNKTRADAIRAWKLVKTASGPNTYDDYRSMISNKRNDTKVTKQHG